MTKLLYGYLIYYDENRGRVQVENPTANHTELNLKLDICWQKLREKEKLEYDKDISFMFGYMIYMNENRDRVQVENPTENYNNITRKLVHYWRELPENEKLEYETASREYLKTLNFFKSWKSSSDVDEEE